MEENCCGQHVHVGNMSCGKHVMWATCHVATCVFDLTGIGWEEPVVPTAGAPTLADPPQSQPSAPASADVFDFVALL